MSFIEVFLIVGMFCIAVPMLAAAVYLIAKLATLGVLRGRKRFKELEDAEKEKADGTNGGGP